MSKNRKCKQDRVLELEEELDNALARTDFLSNIVYPQIGTIRPEKIRHDQAKKLIILRYLYKNRFRISAFLSYHDGSCVCVTARCDDGKKQRQSFVTIRGFFRGKTLRQVIHSANRRALVALTM